MKTLTPSAYAKLRGLNPSTISRQIRAGIIKLRPDGKLDVAATDEAREQNTDPARRLAARIGKQTPVSAAYSTARAKHMQARAAKAEAQVALLRRQLVLRTDVDKAYGAMIAAVRERVATIGSSLAGQLASADSAITAQSLIDEAIHKALQKLSEWKPPTPAERQ